MTKSDERTIAHTFANLLSKAKNAKEEKEITTSLVKVLSKKKAGEHAYAIMKEVQTILHEKEGYIQAQVTVSTRLSTQEKSHIKEIIKKKYKAKDVLLVERLDERIIGGIKIQVGDEVFDGSIKSKLQELRTRLKV